VRSPRSSEASFSNASSRVENDSPERTNRFLRTNRDSLTSSGHHPGGSVPLSPLRHQPTPLQQALLANFGLSTDTGYIVPDAPEAPQMAAVGFSCFLTPEY
jgi:hypothetical protein